MSCDTCETCQYVVEPVNNLEPIIILEPGWRRRPDLYADISVPVLQVPAGKEGKPGGFPNFWKEEEKEEYNEENEKDDEKKEEDDEKKEKDEKKEEMEGKRREEEDRYDSLLVEEGMMVNFPLVHLPLVSFSCKSCYKVLSANKK